MDKLPDVGKGNDNQHDDSVSEDIWEQMLEEQLLLQAYKANMQAAKKTKRNDEEDSKPPL